MNFPEYIRLSANHCMQYIVHTCNVCHVVLEINKFIVQGLKCCPKKRLQKPIFAAEMPSRVSLSQFLIFSKQMCEMLLHLLSTLSPATCLNFPFICNFHVVAADLTIPSLNYISIPATVALVTAAMVTSQSVQVEWPECGP